MPDSALLEISNLHVTFAVGRRRIPAVQGVSLSLRSGGVLGLVGESGCGKSVTSLAVMALLEKDTASVEGSVRLEERELIGLPYKEMNRLRGSRMSMVFQEPMTCLNPVLTIGQQIEEVLQVHQNLTKRGARDLCVRMLAKVGLPDPERVAKSYPHRLSGGQRQRAMIASALCCKPVLLIADEPTTALDVTVQSQVLALLQELQSELGTAILFISHDLGVIAQMADRVAVMYAGRVVEQGSTAELYANPLHPYTRGLLASRTRLDDLGSSAGRRLPSIQGNVPSPDQLPEGCSFGPRCQYCDGRCQRGMPELTDEGEGHLVRCIRAREIA
ncbi:MAG: ABC transporter ATP-binding protein [Oscillospiraceae bacterium]|nr:ABC transporter ATP-binding protein [Oscillospiraceae bacterium]